MDAITVAHVAVAAIATLLFWTLAFAPPVFKASDATGSKRLQLAAGSALVLCLIQAGLRLNSSTSSLKSAGLSVLATMIYMFVAPSEYFNWSRPRVRLTLAGILSLSMLTFALLVGGGTFFPLVVAAGVFHSYVNAISQMHASQIEDFRILHLKLLASDSPTLTETADDISRKAG